MLLEQIASFEETRITLGPSLTIPIDIATPHSSSTKSSQTRPCAKRWDHHLSVESLARTNSTLKASSRMTGPEHTISLGTARPDSQYYPWEALDIHNSIATVREGAVDIDPAAKMSCTKGEEAYNLAAALTYGASAGSPQLLRFITEHVELNHRPPYADWECSLTCSTTSALEIVFRMLCNRGDNVLTEEFTYSGALEAAKPLALNLIPIEMDSDGLIPDRLDSLLRDWNCAAGRKPSVLYTIPTGQNPTGVTQPATRRKAIYEVAERHDLILVEDDPYYFLCLSMDPYEGGIGKRAVLTADAFMGRLMPSYVSLDVSGRVLRLDTVSKILAPGLRCGWISGCSQLIEKFLNHTEFSTTSPSGPSQILLHKLLVDSWGHACFINWLMYLSMQYSRRLCTTIEACKRYLPGELCRWNTPTFGMFVWIEIDWRKHPLAGMTSEPEKADDSFLEIEDKLYQTAKQNGVQVSKGSWFAAETHARPLMNFRITFAAAPREEQLEQAVARFGRAIREEFGAKLGVGEESDLVYV